MPRFYSDITASRAPGAVDDLAARVREFVIRDCIPLEAGWRASGHEVSDDLRRQLMDKARAAGLYGLHLPEAYGGAGLDHRGKAKVLEAAGYSMLGPLALHCAAPDEGNQHLLDVVAQGSQREDYLAPLCAGERSCFMMTEPGGAGADPAMMKTYAVQDGDHYVITGRKWFITGAIGARFAIIMARDGTAADAPPTMFLAPMDTPGIHIVQPMEVMAHDSSGGHCIVDLEGVRVHKSQILGEPGQGFRYAQVRLAPARLTHCMRWLGLSKRCVEIATEYADRREGFGIRLKDRESVQMMLGGLAMEIEIGRLLVMKAAWELDRGGFARKEVSMAKIQAANTLHRAADIAIQINGARGYSKDTVLEWIYRYARQARLVDGADEVHRMVLSRFLDKEGRTFWSWPVAEPAP